jgi:predicted nuclease of restriction endonuclease-like (RecB) superfamily
MFKKPKIFEFCVYMRIYEESNLEKIEVERISMLIFV